MEPGLLGPDVRVAMDLCDERFSVSIEPIQKGRDRAVTTVKADDVEAHSEASQMLGAFECELRLGYIGLVVLWDLGFCTTIWIVGPHFGQVETGVDKGGALTKAYFYIVKLSSRSICQINEAR
jgi:hypothetical protein